MLTYTVIRSYENHVRIIEPKQINDTYRIDILRHGDAGPFGYRIFTFDSVSTQKTEPGGYTVLRQEKSEFEILSESDAEQKIKEFIDHRTQIHLR